MAFPIIAAIAAGSAVVRNLVPIGQVANKLLNSLGSIEDEVIVRVSYAPPTDKQAAYFLAAAIGWGLVKRLVPAGGVRNPFPAPGAIGIEYDAASNEVIFIIKFKQSLKAISATPIGGAGLGAVGKLPVFSGPPDPVFGGAWDATFGIGGVIASPDLPFGPDAGSPTGTPGRTILTSSNTSVDSNPDFPQAGAELGLSPNPRPIGDARSRGSLVWLVSETLATPPGIPAQVYRTPGDYTGK